MKTLFSYRKTKRFTIGIILDQIKNGMIVVGCGCHEDGGWPVAGRGHRYHGIRRLRSRGQPDKSDRLSTAAAIVSELRCMLSGDVRDSLPVSHN